MVYDDRLEAFDVFLKNHAPDQEGRLKKILLQKEMRKVELVETS